MSIIICCHNRRHYLEQTLASVFAQNYRPVEIIIMDDGSTDGTPELMEQYKGRLRYYCQESQGIAVARTNASRLAEGEYIAYQDDDDLMPQDRITHLYRELCRFPSAIFATGDYALIDAQGELTGKRWLPGNLADRAEPVLIEDGHAAVLWPKVPAVPHTTLFKVDYGERVAWFDPEFRYACSDADFLARLGELGPIIYLREIVSYYRRGHNALWSDDMRTSISRLQLWDKHLKRMGERNNSLKERLQERIYNALKIIARHEHDDSISSLGNYKDKFIASGRSHLKPKDLVAYQFYTSFFLPVRNVIRDITQ